MDEAVAFAKMAAATGMYGLQSTEEAFMRLATGIELGLKPAQSLRLLYSFRASSQGAPATVGLYADTMLALCLTQPSICEYFDFVEITPDLATYATKRRGRPEQRLTFTKAQAIQAGYVARNAKYNTEPEVMLKARCIARLARLVYPDILGGMYTPEELTENEPEDLPGARAMTQIAPAASTALALAGQNQTTQTAPVEFKAPTNNGTNPVTVENTKLSKQLWPTDTKRLRDEFVMGLTDKSLDGINAALKAKIAEMPNVDPASLQEPTPMSIPEDESSDPFAGDELPAQVACEWEGCNAMMPDGSPSVESCRENFGAVYCPRHIAQARAAAQKTGSIA
jgi:hypothetical protein